MTIMEALQQTGLVVVARSVEGKNAKMLGEALYQGGARLIELTFNQLSEESWKDTAAGIRALAQVSSDVLPGAGTVMTLEQVHMAFDAGAKYIVCPHTSVKLIEEAKRLGMGALPGALTPSEIVQAYEAGADAIKVFPVGAMGSGYIKALKAPMPHIPMMAVGGISEKNAEEFIRAGAIGVGVGGKLVNLEWIAQGKWENITAQTLELTQAIARGKQG